MALTQLPNPYFQEWMDWVDTVVASNPQAIRLMDLASALTWREVADRLTLMEPAVPRHDSFATWQEWADQLKAVFPN